MLLSDVTCHCIRLFSIRKSGGKSRMKPCREESVLHSWYHIYQVHSRVFSERHLWLRCRAGARIKAQKDQASSLEDWTTIPSLCPVVGCCAVLRGDVFKKVRRNRDYS
jgi:hypothetical protein